MTTPNPQISPLLSPSTHCQHPVPSPSSVSGVQMVILIGKTRRKGGERLWWGKGSNHRVRVVANSNSIARAKQTKTEV
ncbi:hypothetical protein L2E82_27563 [Cichorium intybus]|uniref:Uncharacterized protein n=1 Tax=Cichorium intybus TaxID=13427 RepID=A0ACB9CTC9_CICIN|nr:hypothetical protein L2E82_27563 [Cichorium intybus]